MRTLHAFIKTKLILVALLFVSSVIIATTISVASHHDKVSPVEDNGDPNKTGSSPVWHKSMTIADNPFAATVIHVSPRAGTVAGGTAVTITGAGFTPPNAIFTVKFNGVNATNVVRVSNSVITAVSPAHAPGTVSVTVGINGVEATTENLFTYLCDDPSNIVFAETMGTIPPGPPVSIANHEAANGFDNDNYAMSGTGELRGTPMSMGYPGASGGANVFLTNIFGRDFQIEGINTNSYPNLQISFGIFKNQAASTGTDLNIEVSTDGVNYQALDFAPLPTGTTSTGWYYRIATGPGVPSTPDLRIRFRQNGSTTQYRIDDIRLISSPPITSQPTGIVACPGSFVSFNVTATGNGLTYQWRKNGTDIVAATASSYAIQVVAPTDAGSYDVIIKEPCTGLFTISNAANLSIDNTPPVIITSGTTLTLGCNPSASSISGALGSASATDNCGSPTITQSTGPVQTSGCNRSQIRTFTATDNTGNIATTARTVTWIVDLIPPVFTGSYSSVILGCNPTASSITAALDGATATDACSAPTILLTDGAVVSTGCNRSRTRTFRAMDACGNTSSVSRTVSWTEDMTPPVFIGSYGTIHLGCNPVPTSISTILGVATASDACSTPTLTTTDGPIVSSGCNRSQTRTFMALDACGNTSSISRTVLWITDITPPVFTGSYGTVILICNPSLSQITASLGGATATDACGAPTITSIDGVMVTSGCTVSQTRTFRAVDACGNTASVARTATWTVDNTPPVFTGFYGTFVFDCNPGLFEVSQALGFATATDECSATFITSTDVTFSNGCNRTQVRTFTAYDACGNLSIATRVAMWTEDLTPPAFIGSYATVNLGCNPAASSITAALDGATASDACGAPTLTLTDGAIVSNGCNRTQTRTFRALDACGNTSTVSRTVNWFTDNTPPALTISGSGILGCNPDPEEIDAALGFATALDGCGSPTFVTNTGPVVFNGCNRSQTRTFTSMDACGNFASASRTVVWVVDPLPPAFIGSYGTVNLGCNPSAITISTTLGIATASDACGAPTLTSTDEVVVSNGCNRSQTRTFRAFDACGNSSSVSRTVNWFTDNSPPVLTISGSGILGCNPDPEDIDAALGIATAFDGCASQTLLTNTAPVVFNGCNRSQTRTFTSMDACGNFASASRTVVWVVDPLPPAFIGSYGTINLGCNPSAITISTTLGVATASDACGAPTLTSTDEVVVSNGCNRSQTRTFRAFDACGNSSSVSRTVNWFTDNSPPVLTISGSGILGCNPDPEEIDAALGFATAFDGCASQTLLTNTAPVVFNGCNRSQTRTFTSMDACGNFASASRTVTWVVDPLPPAFIGSYGTVNLGCNPSAITISTTLGVATASDACGAPTLTSTDEVVVSNGCNRSQTRTFRAFDACGNSSSVSRTVNWVADITPPVFVGDYSTVVLGANPSAAEITAALNGAIASDACGTLFITFSNGPVISNGCDRTQTRTFTATDACGNFATISRTVIWNCGQTRVNPIFTYKSPKARPFDVKVYPNPTEHQFSLYVEGANAEKVQVVIYDAIGRQLKKIESGDATGPIRFGEDLKTGAYIVEVCQGVNRKTLKLIKQ